MPFIKIMKTYKTAKGWAILIYIGTPLIIASFLYILSIPLTNKSNSFLSDFLLISVSIAMIALCIIGFLNTLKGSFTIHHNSSVSSKGFFTNKKLMYHEIKGYAINDKFISILPKSSLNKPIKIHTYFENIEEIKHWLSINLSNLDVEKKINETENILKNHDFGIDKKERVLKLKKAKKVSLLVNILSILASVSSFLLPQYNIYITLLLIILFSTCIITMVYFKGLIRLDQEDNSAHPTLLWAFLAICAALTLKAFFSINILNYSNAWLPIFLTPTLLTLLLLATTKEFRFKKTTDFISVLGIFIIFMGITYGALVLTNFYFDESNTTIHSSKIINKTISRGKTTSYYFTLKSWTKNTESIESSVPKAIYNKMEIGSIVTIQQREGRFNIPYYFVSE